MKDTLAKKLDSSKLANNLLTNQDGFALDAKQGPVIQEQIDNLETAISEINSNLVYTIDHYDSTWITFIPYTYVTKTGTGQHIFNCIVNINQNIPDRAELFSVPDNKIGFLTLTQPHTGKSFMIRIANGAAYAWGIIEAGSNCVLCGILP